MKPKCSLPHSQEPATCPNPESDRSSPCPIPLLDKPLQYYPPICAWVFQVVSFPQDSPPKPCMHPFSTPYVPHARDNKCIQNLVQTLMEVKIPWHTRWFKCDRDYLCVNKSHFVPVIFELPCKREDKTQGSLEKIRCSFLVYKINTDLRGYGN